MKKKDSAAQARPKNLPDHKLRVGVTLHLREGAQSIWENGIYQNCVFLVQVLAASPAVAEAVLIIDRDVAAEPAHTMMLDGLDLRIVTMPEAMATLDVVIEMSAQLSEDWVAAFRAKGGRYAWMRVGNDYVIDIERAMFDKAHAGLCNPKVYDAVWTLPEYERSCADYFALTARTQVRIVPHLWTPLFFDQGIAAMPSPLRFGYQPGRTRWRVCCFEPNVCMVKTGVVPLLACEEAYRAQPAFLESLRMCNSLHLKSHSVYLEFARSLDVVQHGLASFEGRHPLYEYMAHQGDCIVSHHWENGQNYVYYEALYGGYPLVHNSEFIRDYGYYYPDFDCQAGGEALLRAFREHDQQLDSYKEHSKQLLRELDVRNKRNVDTYTRELLALYEPR